MLNFEEKDKIGFYLPKDVLKYLGEKCGWFFENEDGVHYCQIRNHERGTSADNIVIWHDHVTFRYSIDLEDNNDKSLHDQRINEFLTFGDVLKLIENLKVKYKEEIYKRKMKRIKTDF